MTSREKFEQAIKSRFGDLIDYRVCKNSDGEYMAWDMQVAWWAWQAAETSMAVQLANAESKCRDLAAENGGLKKAAEFATADDMWIEQADGMLDYRYVDWYVDVMKAAMETPATDAFLAEVRTQVWIEGSEPEEFGRYWVRYETDVGPQYCSAEWMEYNFCAGSNTNIHKIWLADHSRSINSLRGVTHYTKLPDSLEGSAQ
ncbi:MULTISPECIES: hypothetical protein [Citrobacter freundii complex]|uniref:hypothetical protein n=1 Tax=Citrobacter freundii complex TaxID=1344959 RepID=UPI000B6C4312|nr:MULTISPECIES: hypothetical protein [Citrobacter freundii complex]MCR3695643.1 hypothetical protein [Citrobacter portucalensis]MDE8799552.1 hypothetical protein [Citrobacter freundii]MDE8804674.1 hypothetical protein [Citrobacter freundii]OUE62374.1 hypothetical protein AZ002_004593 [Citrobacter freundii]